MTAAHKTVSTSQVALLTPDELLDYRNVCRSFIRQHGPVGWAYDRECRLLNAINQHLAS